MPHTTKRVNLYLNIKQLDLLETFEGTISEHIRRAIDEYIDNHKPKSSESSSKGGINNE